MRFLLVYTHNNSYILLQLKSYFSLNVTQHFSKKSTAHRRAVGLFGVIGTPSCVYLLYVLPSRSTVGLQQILLLFGFRILLVLRQSVEVNLVSKIVQRTLLSSRDLHQQTVLMCKNRQCSLKCHQDPLRLPFLVHQTNLFSRTRNVFLPGLCFASS